MPRTALIVLATLATAAVACGGKDGSAGDETSSTSTSDDATTTSSTTLAPGTSTTGDETTTSGADSSESGPTLLSISGEVTDFFAMGPIAFAQISLLDDPDSATVANRDGTYEIEDLPMSSFHRIRLAPNATYWGAIIPATLEDESLDDYDLSQVSIDVIALQVEALQAQDPEVDVDDQAAVLLIALNQNTATGATVTIDPPPPPGTFYAPDADGIPTLDSNVIEWGLFPVAIFFNMPPGDAGTYSIAVTHPDRECTVQDPEPPTMARHINLIYVDCL